MMLRKLTKITPGVGLVLAVLLAAILPSIPAAQAQTLALPADLFVLTENAQVMYIAAGSGFAANVSPPEQTVTDFGIAPDGQWIAYRTLAAEDGSSAAVVAIGSISNSSGQVIEFDPGPPPITGRGQTLAWSADASAIAYTVEGGLRFYLAGVGDAGQPATLTLEGGPFLNLVWSPGGTFLAAEAEDNVWNVYRRDGTSVVYAGQIPSSAGLAWVREGVLVLAPPTGGLLTLDLRDGTQTALLDASIAVSQPTLISDDRLIFLVHETAGQRFAARQFGTVSTLGGDYEVFDAALELTAAMRWLPDGAALLATIDGTLTLIEPRTNSRQEIFEGVKAYAWGPLLPTEIAGLILPDDLYFLAHDANEVVQLWRLSADGSPAEQVTNEARSVLDYALSPDGSQLAYSSGGNLIVAGMDGTDRVILTAIVERPGAGAQPAWSPDGRLIAFVRDGIWLMPSAGGARTELISDMLSADTPPDQVRVYLHPRWSPDGLRLLVTLGFYEGSGLGILPITGGTATDLPIGSSAGAWLPNGQILVWGAGIAYVIPGLYLVDPADLTRYTTILDDTWQVVDALPLATEAALILRGSGADALGPGAVQPFLVPILPDALPFPQGHGGLIEAPLLSTGGKYVAGLRATSNGDYGLQGRLIIIHLEDGERFAVETPGDVWGLQWGGNE